ncbi:MAG TPA: iron-sulfur cluster assembly protein, partial [Gemmatimonadales bacterium]|nr:iron-sulfur cluster assembly protein [Gemmatimonadales bacterium]
MPGSRSAGAVWCVVWRVARLTRMTTAVLTADAVRQALRQVKDPELDMNIVDLGLVYDVEVDEV